MTSADPSLAKRDRPEESDPSMFSPINPSTKEQIAGTRIGTTCDALEISTTTFERRNSINGTTHTGTWAELVDALTNDPDLTDDKDGLAWVFGEIKPDGEGLRRHKKDQVVSIGALALDCDDVDDATLLDALSRLDKFERAGWPSWSQMNKPKADSVRVRLVFPLSCPVAGADWPRFWTAAVASLGLDKFPGVSACRDSSRLFFNTCPPAKLGEYRDWCALLRGRGAPLDVDAILASSAPLLPVAVLATGVDLNRPAVTDFGFRIERCPIGVSPLTYGEKLAREMPPAIDGQRGGVALLRMARALCWGLRLPAEQATYILTKDYNPRCSPAWTDAELGHKVADASVEAGAAYPLGALLPPELNEMEEEEPSAGVVEQMAAQAWTDVGNAERFSILFGDRVRYCTPRKKWLIWTGQRWEWDEREQITKFAVRLCKAAWGEINFHEPDKRPNVVKNALYLQSRKGLANMLALAQHKCAVLPNELDAAPWLFNVANGTLDLRTGELRAHDRADLMTKLSPVAYDPAARSDLWDSCLAKFSGGDVELAAYLQRAIGYALVGQVTEKHFWFAYGAPDGGKSTFLLAVAGAFGDYHVAADSDTWLARHDAGGNRGDLVRLLGARLVTSVEFKPGARFDPKLMKGVTGGDPLTAAAKYESEIEFTPAFALWLAANDAPTISEDDDGMWRRVRRVPFTSPIPRAEQDPTVQARIQAPEHAAAVLAWAVAGCRAWQQSGLGSCSAVDASGTAYRREMDRVAPFFEEHCRFGPTAEANAGVLRQRYEDWCRGQRVRPVSTREMAAKLRDRDCTSRESNGVTLWSGVTLV